MGGYVKTPSQAYDSNCCRSSRIKWPHVRDRACSASLPNTAPIAGQTREPVLNRTPIVRSLGVFNIAFSLCFVSYCAYAGEFSIRVVDGTAQPVSGVSCVVTSGEDSVFSRVSDTNGYVKGALGAIQGRGGELFVEFHKVGYQDYSASFNSRVRLYTLKRIYGPDDIAQAAGLCRKEQRDALMAILRNAFEPNPEKSSSLEEVVFQSADDLRPALRRLLLDPIVKKRVCNILAFVGYPEDIQEIVHTVRLAKVSTTDAHWAYCLVAALLEPSSQRDWTLLRKCAANDFDNRWFEAGAIQSLQLISTAQSLEILEQIHERNRRYHDHVAQAFDYVKSHPMSENRGRDLVGAAERVAKQIHIGHWMRNEPPDLNQSHEWATVTMRFADGNYRPAFSAIFHNNNGAWDLRAIGEDYQHTQESLGRAIERIKSRLESVLVNQDLIRAGERVAKAIEIGRWEKNDEPIYNSTHTMALIRMTFVSGRAQKHDILQLPGGSESSAIRQRTRCFFTAVHHLLAPTISSGAIVPRNGIWEV